MKTNIRVDGQRLWDNLMELAKIGATDKGGVCRLALTDLDREARDLFVRWCKEAGCTITVDRIGNIFARRPGRDNSLPPVMTGSHIDSQPTGGKFDGAYGVLAGLEVVRTLNDHDYETDAPIAENIVGLAFEYGTPARGFSFRVLSPTPRTNMPMLHNASVEGSGTDVTSSMFATDPEMLANRSVRSMSSSEVDHVPGPIPNPVVGRSLLESGLVPKCDSTMNKLSVRFAAK